MADSLFAVQDTTTTASPLLRLPAELRDIIFTHAVARTTSKTPVIVWDRVYATTFGWSTATCTALLLTCRTVLTDCLPLLYDVVPIELAVYSNEAASIPEEAIDMGPILECGLLKTLKNVELEICFNVYNEAVMSRVVDRVTRLAGALNEEARLKTLQLTFHEANDLWSNRERANTQLLHRLVQITASMKTESLLAVNCNLAASRVIDPEQWQALRQRAENYRVDEEEQFKEISFVYWNHRSQLETRR